MILIYLVVFFSGAAGLAHEIVWHRYLTCLLGAQARATAVTLALFLGGISAGYLCFGRWARRSDQCIRLYALTELGIGIWAWLFPLLFHATFLAEGRIYGWLGLDSFFVDVILGAMLMALPAFFMGGTLPLLTQGLSEDLASASRIHARIYGWNTVGAGLGCLLAGYILIPGIGLAGATRGAGAVNLCAGLVMLVWPRSARQGMRSPVEVIPSSPWRLFQVLLLGIGFLSGFYLTTLETVLTRLIGLAAGSSNYNFTLIVALFIAGLGIGSLLVRRIAQLHSGHLFWNQLLLAVGLLGLYVSGDYWSYAAHVIRATLRDIPQNYYFYQALLGLALAVVVVPVAACAGLTLPLCFHLLKDGRETLGRRVGQLYCWNTFGCVLGALIGGYALYYRFDLDQVFKLCVILALLSSAVAAYLYVPDFHPAKALVLAGGVIFLAVGVGVARTPLYAKERFMQPFRSPRPLEETFAGAKAFGQRLARNIRKLEWKDGPNSSIGIAYGESDNVTLVVNGKSDGNTRGDLFTTAMLAHLPGLLAPKLSNVCVVGFGTGITVGRLAANPEVNKIDVLEISGTTLNKASAFDPYDGGVTRDPKVHFHEMDAFRYLAGSREGIDLLVSEPSNPWVAGVENLYSAEFYGLARARLSESGMLIQWIHSYSFNDELFRLVLRTVESEFPYVSVFDLSVGDLALVASLHPLSRMSLELAAKRFARPEMKKKLSDLGLQSLDSVLALELMPPVLSRVVAGTGEVQTLDRPELSDRAARAFFEGSWAHVRDLRSQYHEYYASIDDSLLAVWEGLPPPSRKPLDEMRDAFCDNEISRNSDLCQEVLAIEKVSDPLLPLSLLYSREFPPEDGAAIEAFSRQAAEGAFHESDLRAIHGMIDVYRKYASPIARIPTTEMFRRLGWCLRKTQPSDPIYGKCLLEKTVLLETRSSLRPQFEAEVRKYLKWFPTVRPDSSAYPSLLDAKQVLEDIGGTTHTAVSH